ncbi:hypothetical protein [Pseudohongiella sp. O18]|uniref:hypothetical protein n=1 Tax=Pseudohongiella sp. O18 TaxID=2904248 RepID=UPI001F330125|nr:hypothetical protein [Pseudohongiella sp. O18]
MSDHESIDARLEQALSAEFSNIDSDLFSEKVATRISRKVFLRYLVLSIGWLTGLTVFFSILPVLNSSLMSINSFLPAWTHQELLFRLSQWLIPASIMLAIAIMPALLSRLHSRVN